MPSIPLGWVGAGFSPTASTPRAWDLSRGGGMWGGETLTFLKWVPNFSDDDDDDASPKDLPMPKS